MFIKKSMLFHELIISQFPPILKSFQRCPEVADAFVRMKKALQNIPLSGRFAGDEAPLSRFVLVRLAGMEFGIKDIFYKTAPRDRGKIQLLLQTFSTGKVLNEDDIFESH
jgi:hypothetical protein